MQGSSPGIPPPEADKEIDILSRLKAGRVCQSIEQFKKDFELSNTMTNSEIKRSILEPAKAELKEANADVWFDYEMKCFHPKKGVKPKNDTIIFKIKTLHPQEAGGEQFSMYKYVYNWIYAAAKRSDDLPVKIADSIASSGRLKEIYERFCYWDDLFVKGEMTRDHVHNSIRKVLRDDFNFKI